MKGQTLLMKARAGRIAALSQRIEQPRRANVRGLSTSYRGPRLSQDVDVVDRLFSNLDFTFNAGRSA
ncbi:hypothetical protein SAMN05444287_2244 [Octadecabacter temperatus]|uniref:Uncharacterized protein n=1 Tax=Octadecabacter temperatus TaxID=1458307 RepID=A0A0K0Y1S9_9RHOB|nr:hypothetical protein [Octadecabacter temperatus]AKS44841.1 hypothetical protein OSB_02730 [Octadecabacter temperatus]SIO34652.1 hypothetical protein SAMN05444287_2244 [Octadecabacter temperatus]